MYALVVYDSQYGNTKQIAEAIARVFKEYGSTKIISAEKATRDDFAQVGLVAVGGPTQAHGITPALEGLLEGLDKNFLAGVPALAFDTRYKAPALLTGAASGIIEKLEKRLGCTLLLPHESFFVDKSEGPLLPGEVERAEAWAHAAWQRLVPSGAVLTPA